MPAFVRQNAADGIDNRINFSVGIIKVRRDANPRVGTVVHQDVSRQQFAGNFVGMRTVDTHLANKVIPNA